MQINSSVLSFRFVISRDCLRFVTSPWNCYVHAPVKETPKKLSLTRKNYFFCEQSVFDFVNNQLEKSEQSHGYRWMHQKCKLNGFKVKRVDIRLLLKVVDQHDVD